MPCQVSKLSHAFCVQGGNEWAMWAYGDNCPVEEMLMPGFFSPAHTLLRVGDLLLMGSVPLPKRSEEQCRMTSPLRRARCRSAVAIRQGRLEG